VGPRRGSFHHSIAEEKTLMNQISLRLSVCALALVSAMASAAVPSVDSGRTPATTSCGTDPDTGRRQRLRHFAQVIFIIDQSLIAQDPRDQPVMSQLPQQTELDIKLAHSPTRIADLEGKVLAFLGAFDSLQNRQRIRIIDVDYTVVCTR
jgi:hypothetical protein